MVVAKTYGELLCPDSAPIPIVIGILIDLLTVPVKDIICGSENEWLYADPEVPAAVSRIAFKLYG